MAIPPTASARAKIRAALTSRGQTAFLSAALLLGILVGLGASLLVWSIAFVTEILVRSDSVAGIGKWMVVASIPAGLLASWSLNRWLGPGISGGGVAETMVSVNLEGGYLPTRLVPTKIAATAATLGTGGSGGREGPIVLIGAAIGSSFARHSNFGLDQIKSLVAAGAGAGIGASFNAPIAGMVFALEVILQSFAVRHFSAVVVTSVAAAVTTHTLVGEELFLQSPPHELKDPRQLILFAILAIVTVAFGILFLRVLDITSEANLKAGIPTWVLPISLGVVVALIGIAYPETLGTGEQFLTGLLSLRDAGDYLWWSLFIIAALKTVTSALTRKGGGSVGTFMPALVFGGAAGAGFAILVDPIWTVSDIDPGAFALVGMAAALAATARAPLTAVILVFELTGDYGLVLPLMLAVALATFLGDRLHPESTYTMSLARKGIRLPSGEDIDLLDTVRVEEVMSAVDVHATLDMPLTELEDILERSHHHGLPVVEVGKLVGIVTFTDLERISGPLDDLTVGDVFTVTPIVVTPNMPVSAALARMASLGLGRLPVVADDDPTELVGMFRRQSIVSAYHRALGTSTGRHLYRDRLKVRTQPGAMFFEVSISKGSGAVGTLVKDIEWPNGAILVSIRRGSRVLIPHGDTTLEAADILTAFGTGESREKVASLVEPVHDPAST
ncbi:MAG: chloride channel protein [Actinomycetia bacterium]|nr:chloride channel protein [Actinomycetes bacterium]